MLNRSANAPPAGPAIIEYMLPFAIQPAYPDGAVLFIIFHVSTLLGDV